MSGAVLETSDFYPLGLVMPTRSYVSGSATREKFTGKERDVETGLDYFGARYYMPALGRWTSVDPLAEKHPEWNPYNYVLGNPLRLIDPDGRQVAAAERMVDQRIQRFAKSEISREQYMQEIREQAVLVDNLSRVYDPYDYARLAVDAYNGTATGWDFVGAAVPFATGPAGRMVGNLLESATDQAKSAERAFHHTFDNVVENIQREGLRPGSYATPTDHLSPLQAHIELALNPAKGPRNAVLQIDLVGLRAAGYEIPPVTRVTGAFGMPGGGYEMVFPYAVPSEFIEVIQP